MKVETLYTITIGVFLVCHYPTLVLFDLGSTYSYISVFYASRLVLAFEPLIVPMHVSTIIGDSLIVNNLYRFRIVIIWEYYPKDYLIVLDMVNFDVIMSMYWLSPYHALLDCFTKIFTLAILGIPLVCGIGIISYI